MTQIRVSYAALADGYHGLVATWNRIESHLAELDATVAATGDMQSQALTAYAALKARWTASAAERQGTLRALADAVDRAAQLYREVDAAAAAQFAG
ncbi:MAG TPA: hypothetical protein VFM01_04630 [Nakamurella sp.]|nr:hypothetical protein [Nakamurella sp.]